MFLTFETWQTFIKLKQVFIKVLILNHFDLEHYIFMKTNVSTYIISKIFS